MNGCNIDTLIKDGIVPEYFVFKVVSKSNPIRVERIDNQDVVPVVRCVDCKHSQSYEKCKPFVVCHKHQSFNEPDWFCKDGEKVNE